MQPQTIFYYDQDIDLKNLKYHQLYNHQNLTQKIYFPLDSFNARFLDAGKPKFFLLKLYRIIFE